MDQVFDLDMAFAIPGDSMIHHDEPDAQSVAAARHMVGEMPTVIMGGGCDCMVCLEGFGIDSGAGKKVQCGHVFHENCISQWLSVHTSCPLCRLNLPVSS